VGDPSKPPLFALTSLDGSGTLFAPLQAEGDVYALQHEHVGTGARAALSEASLAELAAKYAALILAEMVRRDPAAPNESAAPFVLIGVSFGAFLAHHVAVAADALGHPAAGLVLLEPWPVPPLLRDVIGTDRPQQVCTVPSPRPLYFPLRTLSTPSPRPLRTLSSPSPHPLRVLCRRLVCSRSSLKGCSAPPAARQWQRRRR
tara:strand:- start:1063 stop:1668 length:606 start_codon:yes stop_codon:yes gene_type:complete